MEQYMPWNRLGATAAVMRPQLSNSQQATFPGSFRYLTAINYPATEGP